jgi:GAF domain-containing protein
MKGRSRAGGGTIKGRRAKTPKPLRRNVPKVKAHSKPSPVADEREVARLARERDEALEQQTAASEVLRVISASSGDLEPVFQAMLERAVRICDATAFLAVPMLKNDELIGAIGLFRHAVRSFTDRQIELVKGFAAQAVIAIENARLLNELRQRTDDLTGRTADLTEALEQQTATSEVLQVISSSPGDLQPVFASMLVNAVRICDATFGVIYRWDGDALHLMASHSAPPAYVETQSRSPFRPHSKTFTSRMLATKAAVHGSDLTTEPIYLEERDPVTVASVEQGIRSFLLVPMLGSFHLFRKDVRPFTGKQIALVTSFASQAVIAIENARLLKELRERTDEVEKLNQQLEQRVTDQAGEIERMSRLRRFLPPQVADLIVASGSEKQLESHRREITALFCDLRGFTGFTESADAEDVMALLRDYHAAIGEIIIKYNGTLERYAGDGVMVVFTIQCRYRTRPSRLCSWRLKCVTPSEL